MTPSRTSKQRSKTRKELLQSSNDLSSLESSSKMAEPFRTTTSKRSPLSTLSFDFVVVPCKSSSRHSLAKPSLWTSKQTTPSKTSRLRSRTRKEFLQSSNDSSSLESSLKTDVLCPTTTSRRSPLSILFFVFVVVPCKSS